MKKMILLSFALAFLTGMTLLAKSPVPRQPGPLKLHFPMGPDITLASLKGKVVVLQFLFTGCSHCQHTAQGLSKLQAEFAAKGLKVYGVAFNDEVNTKNDEANKKEVARFGQYATFPIAMSAQAPVAKFLGISTLEWNQMGVPQLVVIDRKGVIQAQTPLEPGQGSIVEDARMRAVVSDLLAGKKVK